MPRRPWLLLAAVSAALALSSAPRSEPVSPPVSGESNIEAPPRTTGQWIWTRADADIFARTRVTRPDLAAAVLAATITAGPGGIELHRGLSPTLAGEGRPVALVVRIDDSLHALWDVQGVDSLALELGGMLARVLADARATGTPVSELELDYDAPERRLALWSAVVVRLTERELAGVPVWVTSIPAHLEDGAYFAGLTGHVRGHILQLFDTGLACSPAEIGRIRAALERQPLAFRIGVGAFERTNQGRRTTDHACWFASVAELRTARGFAGSWVFPAGRDYASRISSLVETSL